MCMQNIPEAPLASPCKLSCRWQASPPTAIQRTKVLLDTRLWGEALRRCSRPRSETRIHLRFVDVRGSGFRAGV